ncbi:MAG: AsmA family protein [Parvibaculales bacterium]
MRLLSVLVPITLVIAAAFLVPFTLDIDARRDQITAQISRDMNIDITAHGPVSLRLLPSPALQFENIVSVVNRPKSASAPSMPAPSMVVSANEVDAGVSLISLLDGKLKVRNLALRHAEIRIIGLDDVGAATQALRLAPVPEITFADVRLIMQRKGTAPLRLSGLSGRFQADAADGPFRLSVQRQVRGLRSVSLNARIGSFVTNRLPLRLSARIGTDSGLQFNGFFNQRPNATVEGEISLRDKRLIPDILSKLALETVSAPSQTARVDGLIRLTEVGLFADNLEIGALQTRFQSQLGIIWSRAGDGAVQINSRLSADEIDFDLIGLMPQADKPAATEKTDDPLRHFWPSIEIDARVLSGRFLLGGEVGRNFVIDLRTGKNGVRINRFSADLPFNSSILAAAELVGPAGAVKLSGDMAVRSSDSVAALLWLGAQAGYDLSPIAETVDEPLLQRMGLVTEFSIGPEQIRLGGLTGRIGGDQLELDLDVSRTDRLRGHLDLNLSQANLQTFGLMENIRLSRPSPFPLLGLPVGNWLQKVLQQGAAPRDFTFNLRSDDMRADNIRLGPVTLNGRIIDDRLELDVLRFDDYLNSKFSLTGKLHHDGQATDGVLDIMVDTPDASRLLAPLMAGVEPLHLDMSRPLALASNLQFPARDDPDWPNIKIAGTGKLGDLDIDLGIRTPVRDLTLDAAGTRFNLTLKGSANDMTARLGLPVARAPEDVAVLSLSTDAQPGSVSRLEAELDVNGDLFSLSGTLRPGSTGRRIEGLLRAAGTDVLPYMGMKRGPDTKVAFSGTSQIVMRQEGVSFANIDLGLGAGRLTGEGVMEFADDNIGARNNLTANLLFDALDLDPFMPAFDTETGWSDAPIGWQLLGASDANLQLRLTNAALMGMPVEALRTNIKLVEGVLEAPDITATVLGGQFEFDAQAEGGELTPSFQLIGSFADFDMERLLTHAYTRPALRALVSGNFSFQGRGTSTRNIFASLSGAAQVEIRSGTFDAFNVAQLRNGLGAFDDRPQNELAEAYFWKGRETFSRGLGLLTLREGRLETSALEILRQDNRLLAKMSGYVDFVEQRLNVQSQFYNSVGRKALSVGLTDAIDAPRYAIARGAITSSAQ